MSVTEAKVKKYPKLFLLGNGIGWLQKTMYGKDTLTCQCGCKSFKVIQEEDGDIAVDCNRCHKTCTISWG